MNCCDDYGQCTQGANCPVRENNSIESLAKSTATRYRPGAPPMFEFDTQALKSFVLALDFNRSMTKRNPYFNFKRKND